MEPADENDIYEWSKWLDPCSADEEEMEYTKDINGEFVPVEEWPDNKRQIGTADSAPKNNDNRDTCYWCEAPTKSVDTGMFADMRICTKCGK